MFEKSLLQVKVILYDLCHNSEILSKIKIKAVSSEKVTAVFIYKSLASFLYQWFGNCEINNYFKIELFHAEEHI